MPAAPRSIGRYVVQSRLGAGGMGEVYLGRDSSLDRLVAIKLLKEGLENDELRERFGREARTIAKLAHPNIVIIYELGEHEGTPFIAMEYVAGETLGEVIRRRAPLSLVRKLQIMEEICGGVASAHRAGVVHRDIKPANIMVGSDGTVKILDFGIARIAGSGMTQQGMLIGTLNYMSPEQILSNPVDHRSDMFAVAAVFYELLSGRQAFPGSFREVLVAIPNAQPPVLSSLCQGLPSRVEEIVKRGLEKDPANRYRDLDRMRRDVSQVREQLEEEAAEREKVDSDVASTVRLRRPPPPKPAPSGPDPDRLAQRRRSQVDAHLASAQHAFDEGRLEEAIDFCEMAVAIDSSDARPGALIERCRAAFDARQIRQWLDQAQQLMERADFTAAQELVDRCLEVNPASKDVTSFARDLQRAHMAAERAHERQRLIQATLERAQQRLAEGAFDSALRAVSEALAFDPENAAAQKLSDEAARGLEDQRREQALSQRAGEAVAQARELFDAGRHSAALDMLAAFEPPHDLVGQTLRELRDRRAEIERRESEEKERRATATRLVVDARVALDERRFDAALAAAKQAQQVDPEISGAEPLIAEIETALARRAQCEKRLARADVFLAANDPAGALREIVAALALDPGNGRAVNLRKRAESAIAAAEEARRRTELEASARKAVDAAERAFGEGRHEEALDRLRQFAPAHEAVAAALATLQREADRVAAERRRAEEEAQRIAEERLARDARVARELETARVALAARRFAEAQLVIARLRQEEPGLAEAQRLDAEIRAAEAAAAAERQRQREVEGKLEAASAALALGSFAEALEAVGAVLTLQPGEPAAVALQKEAQQAQAAATKARKREQARADQAVKTARRKFADGGPDAAIVDLEQFSPPHDIVTNALTEMRERARKQRKAAEEATRVARDQAVTQAREQIERHLASGALADAARALADAEGRLDARTELTDLRPRIQEAVEARQQEERRAREAREQEERRTREARELAEREKAKRLARDQAIVQAREQIERHLASGALADAERAVVEAERRYEGIFGEGFPLFADLRQRIEQAVEARKQEDRRTREARELKDQRAREARESKEREEAQRLARSDAIAQARKQIEGHLAAGALTNAERTVAEAEGRLDARVEFADLRQRIEQAVEARQEEERRSREARELEERRAREARELAAREEAQRLARSQAIATSREQIERHLANGDLVDADRAIADVKRRYKARAEVADLKAKAAALRARQAAEAIDRVNLRPPTPSPVDRVNLRPPTPSPDPKPVPVPLPQPIEKATPPLSMLLARLPLVGGVAAALLVAIVLAVWRPWSTASPPPPTVVENVAPVPKGPSLFDQASSRLAAGQRSEALTLALQSLRADPAHQPTLQLLARLRSEAADAAAAAREKAVNAGGPSHAEFNVAEQKAAEAQALADPVRTADAVRTFDEATQLYQRIETEAFSPAKFLVAAQQERGAGRTERALSYALDGIKQYPTDQALAAFLTSLRRDAASKMAQARTAAVKAGATDASASFKSARDRERFAAARGGVEQTAEALTAFRDAEALYQQAGKEAIDLKAEQLRQQTAEAEKLRQDIDAGLQTAENAFKAGRLEEAGQAVDAVLAKESTNTRARQLQQQVRAAITERDRLASNTRERERRQREAATFVDQANRAASPEQAIALLQKAEQLDPTNADIAPLLAKYRSAGVAPPPVTPTKEAVAKETPAKETPPKDIPPKDTPPKDTPPPAVAKGKTPEDVAREEIGTVLRDYERAYETRNVDTMAAIWPSRRIFYRNHFDAFDSVDLTISNVAINLKGADSAVVTCQIDSVFRWKRAGADPRQSQPVVLQLSKIGGRWQITTR